MGQYSHQFSVTTRARPRGAASATILRTAASFGSTGPVQNVSCDVDPVFARWPTYWRPKPVSENTARTAVTANGRHSFASRPAISRSKTANASVVGTAKQRPYRS